MLLLKKISMNFSIAVIILMEMTIDTTENLLYDLFTVERVIETTSEPI